MDKFVKLILALSYLKDYNINKGVITIKATNIFIEYFKKTNKLFWIVSILISAYSLALLASVSRNHGNYFRHQFIAIIAGYISAYIFTKVNYQVVAKRWYIPAGICLALLAYSLFFGASVEGSDGVNAKAWIILPGNITFQPSELAKIGFMITFSQHLAYLKKQDKIKEFKHVALLGVHALIPIIITHVQGDDGAAIIFFFMFLTMSFAAGIQLRYFIAILLAIAIAFPIAWKFGILEDYQKERLLIMFNLDSNLSDYGYQQFQGRTSIASGKILGRGLFSGPRVGNDDVPVAQSDFIFSVVGEELGFIGCIAVIILLTALICITVYIAKKSCDDLGKYICYGFIGMIMSQTIFNLGMCLNILPVMGVTLPFFSAGGSSAACLYLAIGLVQNVFMHRDNKDLILLEENN